MCVVIFRRQPSAGSVGAGCRLDNLPASRLREGQALMGTRAVGCCPLDRALPHRAIMVVLPRATEIDAKAHRCCGTSSLAVFQLQSPAGILHISHNLMPVDVLGLTSFIPGVNNASSIDVISGFRHLRDRPSETLADCPCQRHSIENAFRAALLSTV